jgi:hypothetical protein
MNERNNRWGTEDQREVFGEELFREKEGEWRRGNSHEDREVDAINVKCDSEWNEYKCGDVGVGLRLQTMWWNLKEAEDGRKKGERKMISTSDITGRESSSEARRWPQAKHLERVERKGRRERLEWNA